MTIYDRAKAMVDKAFASDKFVDATLARANGATFDPVKGEVSSATPVVIQCRALLAVITTKASDGALVFTTVATINVEPLVGDTLTIGQNGYRVQSTSSVAPVGQAIIHKAVLSK